MFCFERAYLLYALLFVPVMVAGYILLMARDRKRWERFGEPVLLDGLMPSRSFRMRHFKFSLYMLAYSCMVLALANPQVGSGVEKGKRQGVDLMFCVDVSNSMLARDYSPNRLGAVRQGMLSLIDRLGGDRVGLVVFAGKSFVQLPITSDYAAAKMFISNISTRSVSEQGTDLAGAIDRAAASMLPVEGSAATNSKVAKVIVLVSDGEDHADDAVEMAKAAASRGIRIYTVGIGSSQGEPIPVSDRNGVTTFKKDAEGNTVITRLNEPLLKEVAAAAGGSYIHATNAIVSFDRLYDSLQQLERGDLEDVVYSRYRTLFYIPLIIALILLLLEVLLPNRRIVRWSEVSWLNRKIVGIFALLLMTAGAQAQDRTTLQHLRQGNRTYQQAQKLERQADDIAARRGDLKKKEADEIRSQAEQKYKAAALDYMKADASSPYYKSSYNLGNALYKQGGYEEAAKNYEKAASSDDADARTRAKAYHNLGNSLVGQKKYGEAMDAYKKALKLDPKDMDTKYNYEYARRKMLMQQQQQQQQRQRDEQRQLEALQQNERRTQEKVKNAEAAQGRPVRQEKDW
ncbi:MAG: VWA domain-containing protein [Bacteroidales bacterium]|nr:VWA domain-containing protein [Bacteroidales bacterium]